MKQSGWGRAGRGEIESGSAHTYTGSVFAFAPRRRGKRSPDKKKPEEGGKRPRRRKNGGGRPCSALAVCLGLAKDQIPRSNILLTKVASCW